MTAASPNHSAEIRAGLDHPVVDTDGHMMEHLPVFLDYLKETAGPDMVSRFVAKSNDTRENSWHVLSPQERRDQRVARPPFWQSPARNTIDRATAMLPGMIRERLDEFGFDYAIIYPTLGFYMVDEPDEDIRRASCRAHNTMAADLFRDHSDRLTTPACIPTHTPTEAIDELEYAVNTLSLKAAMIANLVHRPVEAVVRAAPELARHATWTDCLGIDSDYDYDPFWAKCVELGVAPTAHSRTQGRNARRSTTNFMYNQIGHFAESGDAFARALFFGGVTRRFPELNFGLLEGGVGWACSVYAKLVGAWEKRNFDVIDDLNPANIDMEVLSAYFDKYGGKPFEGKLAPRDQGPKGGAGDMGHAVTRVDGTWSDADSALKDDFAACKITRPEDIADLFIKPFYFGCEADDPMNAAAFGGVKLPFDAKPKAIFGSDIGHWDVPHMNGVLAEAYELVDDGMLSDTDFREFTFANPVMLHAGMNPHFFEGTVIEDEVNMLLASESPAKTKV